MTRIHDKLKQHRYIFSNLEKEFHSENTWDKEDNLGDELRIYQQHIYICRQYLDIEVGSLPLGSTQIQITFCHPFHKLF